MNDVIVGLGYHPGGRTRLGLGFVVGSMSLLFVVLPHVVVLLGVSPVVLQAVIAAAWCYWLGWVFPKRWRAQVGARGHAGAYRAAFLWDIVPGVCGNFAQILRPAFYGLLAGWPVLPPSRGMIIGALLIAGGGALILLALRVIGIAGAMFVWEYCVAQPALTTRGIYGIVRHPLFVGGVIASCGLALVTGGTTPLMMALVNVAVVPAFLVAEKRRLTLVFGDRFLRYRADVPAVLPRVSFGSPEPPRVPVEPAPPVHAAAVQPAFTSTEPAEQTDRFHWV